MLLLGHIGITLGAAALLTDTLLRNGRLSQTTKNKDVKSSLHRSGLSPNCEASWLTYLENHIDIRLLLIGSLLPDIIDKPIGHLLFREMFNNGRIFPHTLLFLILVTISGIYLYKCHKKTWLIAFSFGTLAHLVFDQMWHAPRTLFWPLMGLTFERIDISDLVPNIIHALLTDPAVYLPELLGAVILVWFAWLLFRKRKIRRFIKYGQAQ